MKTTIKLLALLFLISCKTSDDNSRLRGLLVDDINREMILLDFSEDYAELRNNIAKKHQVDLCDTILSFKSLIPLKNDDSVLVNLSVFDICFPYIPVDIGNLIRCYSTLETWGAYRLRDGLYFGSNFSQPSEIRSKIPTFPR